MAEAGHDRFLIAGGGIGGLAAALGLARKGHRSIVLEQAARFGEIGAGIQLGPNAFHAFDRLGVGDAARAKAVYVDHLILMDAVADRRITDIPLDEAFRKRFGNPYAVMHRGDLHAILYEACRADPQVELRTDSRVVRYEQDRDAIAAVLASGTRLEGTALVGADGLWSAVRIQVIGDGPPTVSGHTTFRSVIPTDRMPEELRWNAATLWAGPKCHIVHYPLKGGQVFNLVATYDSGATEPVAGSPVDTDFVRATFGHVCERAQRIVAQGESWRQWVLCDREPARNWVDGRALLLGDAAHPMLQYFAQGACMALEDAVCLAEEVDRHPGGLPRAFAAYNRRRAPRTGRVQMGSRLLGQLVYHPEGAKADVRNAVLGAMSPEDHYARLQWLYGGEQAVEDSG